MRGHLQLEACIEGSTDNLLEMIRLGGVNGPRMTQEIVDEGEGILNQLVQLLSGMVELSLFDDGAVTQESPLQHTRVLLCFKNV